MKLLITIFLLIQYSFAFDTRPEVEIDKINQLTDKKEIFKALKVLKLTNETFKKEVLASPEYLPESFHYAVTLEELLKVIPEKLEDIPNCREIYSQIINSFKEEWNDMPKPTHHIWPSFNKLCL